MKEWNFKIKKLCSKHLKLWLMNWDCTNYCISKKLLRRKAIYLYYSMLILKKLKYLMSYTITLHSLWGHILVRGTRNCHQRIWQWLVPYTVYKETLIKRQFFYECDKTEIRRHCYRSLTTFWDIFGCLCTQLFIHWHRVRVEVICVVKSEVILPKPTKYKIKIF